MVVIGRYTQPVGIEVNRKDASGTRPLDVVPHAVANVDGVLRCDAEARERVEEDARVRFGAANDKGVHD